MTCLDLEREMEGMERELTILEKERDQALSTLQMERKAYSALFNKLSEVTNRKEKESIYDALDRYKEEYLEYQAYANA